MNVKKYIKNYKKNSFKIFSGVILTFILMISFFYMDSYANEDKVIRVGIFNFDGFYQTSETGIRFGYGYDYLNEIAKYKGYSYEFVEGDWDELFLMLQNGEIDLMNMVQKTPDRETTYQFSEFSTGMSYGGVYVRADDENFAYGDIQSLDGKRIGFLKDNSRNEEFFLIEQENGLETVHVEYGETKLLQKALQNKEVDAIVTSSLKLLSNEKEVLRFNPSPFYIITNKNNPGFTAEINDALKQIQIDKIYFNLNLYKKYFEKNDEQVRFTRKEANYIENAKEFTMVYDSSRAPFEYYDEKEGDMQGINIEIINLIEERSGLKFKYVPSYSYKQSIDMVGRGQVDFLSSFDANVDKSMGLNMVLTTPFVSSPIAIVGNDDEIIDNKVFALPRMYVTEREYVKKVFPDNNIVIYDTMFDCYDAILNNKADYTLENVHVAGEVIEKSPYDQLSIIYTTSLMDEFSMAARSTIDPIVLDILNKTIDTITPEEIALLINKYTFNRTEELSMSRVFDEYKFEISVFSCIFLIAAFCVAVYIILVQKRGRETLWNMAYTDSLTGLPNLSKFKLDAEKLLARETREAHVLVRFDVDKFKIINDMFGFEEGDRVLQSIAKTITGNIKEGSLFARIANDEFIILTDYKEEEKLVESRDRLYKAFNSIQQLGGRLYQVNFSVGIYHIRETDTDVSAILDRTGMAHKQAKLMENNAIVFYNDSLRDGAIRTKEIENTMDVALQNGEFVVYMQPKFNLDTLKLGGAEALVRWKHLVRGIISPDDFIPIFEKNGFVISIDNFMLEQTCICIRRLIDTGISPVPISVNQSKLHLKNPNYVSEIKAVITKYQIPPSLIEIELTETCMHENLEVLLKVINELHEFGCIISIDDFGSGYSSLNLLKDLPANVLKIDKGFLERSEKTDRGKTVLSNMIRLAKELDMQVVTEGVETKEQEALLREIGSDMVQGFLYARPMPLSDFEELLKK